MKILVPLDGSVLSESVFPCVASLAQREGFHVILMRATEPFLATPYALAYELSDELRKKIVNDSSEYLARAQSHLSVQNLSTCSVVGHAQEEICRTAQDMECDLIVMTSHGASGLRQFFLGSVADGVVRMAPCPVLLIRQPPPQQCDFRHILIPIDGSPASLSVVQKLSAFLSQQTKITLLAATGLSPHDYVDIFDRGQWQTYMEKLENNLLQVKLEGVPLQVKVLDGEADQSILSWAAEADCDLIAMASHGCGSLRRLLLGSVVQKVLRQAPCSVLVVPAGLPQEEN